MLLPIVAKRTPAGLFAEDETGVDGEEKVRGELRYTADIKRPDMLWAAYTTSPFAHAKIVRIDTSEAKALPGVRAVLTAADIGHRLWGRNLFDWPVLAWDRVRLIGDRVAAIAAETREAAEEAARLVDVEYEQLPALLSTAAALAADAPVLHPDRARKCGVRRGRRAPDRTPDHIRTGIPAASERRERSALLINRIT